MADISAIFFVLLILGVASPALLIAWWLLFPSVVERARLRLEKTPLQAFGMGIVFLITASIPTVILLALPFGPAKFLGWILLAAALTLSSFGSAGIAAHLAARLSRQSNISGLNGFLCASVVLELAAFLPVLGWFFVWPVMLITAFGAAGFSLLNWSPREKTQNSSAAPSASHA